MVTLFEAPLTTAGLICMSELVYKVKKLMKRVLD